MIERSEMRIDFKGATPDWSDAGKAVKAFPKEHPYVTGAGLALVTAGVMDVQPALALSPQVDVVYREASRSVKEWVDYATENWGWFVPTLATINGLIDATVNAKRVNDARSNANKQDGQKRPAVSGAEFRSMWFQQAVGESMEMVTVLAAAKTITGNPDISNSFRNVGYISLLFASFYAFTPDSANPLIKSIGNRLLSVGSVLNSRAAKEF